MVDLSSIPSDIEGKRLWNDVYRQCQDTSIWSRSPVPYIEEKVAVMLASRNCQSAVDIPCGDGRNTVPISRVVKRVIAADSSSEALTKAQEQAVYLSLNNCSYERQDVLATTWEDNSFDAALCWDLLGLIRQPVDALMELFRVLKPGGILIANFFSLDDPMRQDDMTPISTNEYLYRNKIYYKFYNEEAVNSLFDVLPATLLWVERTTWSEPPHDKYRNYEHIHDSHVAVAECLAPDSI